MWRITGLGFNWPGQTELFAGLTLNIALQDRILLRGANGSGKTTLLRLLTGSLRPVSGSVLFHSKEAREQKPETWKHLIYLPQSPREGLFGLTPWHDFELWRLAQAERIPATALSENPDAISAKADTPFFSFSAGELRAAAQLYLPWLTDLFWLLDEPTAGLDAQRLERFVGLLRLKADSGSGMLVASHDPALPQEIFNRVLVLSPNGLGE